MENHAIVADSMTRVLFRRVFWSLLLPCFVLSYRAWKQSASFYYSQSNLTDHLPPAFQEVSYHMHVSGKTGGRTSSIIAASETTKPKWFFVHLASGERLPTLKGSSFLDINPTTECPRIFSQQHQSQGPGLALQLPCFQDMIGNRVSTNGPIPLTFLDLPLNATSDTLGFWKKLIDNLSKNWDVVVIVLYEPFFTFAVHEWPVTLAERAQMENLDKEQTLQTLAKRHTAAHLTPFFDNVKIVTSWQEAEYLIKGPIATEDVTSLSVAQKCAPCLPHSLKPHIITLSSEQEHKLLGPRRQANNTRLGHEYEACLRSSGCPVDVDDSSERWHDGALISR